GVYGATCSHDFSLAFMNIKTPGERYYIRLILVLNQIIKKFGSHIAIMYDVGCKLKPALKNVGELSPIHNAPMAVSVFHIYGHEAKCQAKYHPYTLAGFGLRDGENLERLWSYLGGFSSTTRYMSPENRQLVLTRGLTVTLPKNSKKLVC
ncbi:hypothetical protein BDC45DRAFT_441537, partial [Circinella umbellata]